MFYISPSVWLCVWECILHKNHMQVFLMVKQLTSNSHMSAHILRRYFRPHTATQNKKGKKRFSAIPLWRVSYLLMNWKSLSWEQRFWINTTRFCFYCLMKTLMTKNLTNIIKSFHRPLVILQMKIATYWLWSRFILQNPMH